MNYQDMTESELLLARTEIEAELHRREMEREADELAALEAEIGERLKRYGERLDLSDPEQARGLGQIFPIPF